MQLPNHRLAVGVTDVEMAVMKNEDFLEPHHGTILVDLVYQ
jgi:hypothetical protein